MGASSRQQHMKKKQQVLGSRRGSCVCFCSDWICKLLNMSRLQSLKVFIYQRLTATVEEVIEHLERTLSQYEEDMECRHCKLLTASSGPPETIEVQQLVIKDEVSSEQQQWTPSLKQEDPTHQQIKDEEQDFWLGLEHEQLQRLYEEEVTNVPFTTVPVKNTHAEEKAQSSQLHQRQMEENREAESPGSSSTQQIKTEDCGGSQPGSVFVSGFQCLSGSDKTSHSPEAETEDSGNDWKETRKPHADFNIIKTKVSVNDIEGNKMFSCSKCGKRFGQKHHLQTHMRCHTGEKPFSCSLCGKRFTQKGNMTQHLTVHTREKPCSCPVCGERFAQKGNLTQHMTVHTREKLCW